MSETETGAAARPRFPLHFQRLVGFAIGLSAGLVVNLTAGDAACVKAVTTYVTGPAGQVFLRTLLFTLLLSTISVVVALVLVNVIRPGGGVDPALARAMLAQAGSGAGAIIGSGRDRPHTRPGGDETWPYAAP